MDVCIAMENISIVRPFMVHGVAQACSFIFHHLFASFPRYATSNAALCRTTP